MREISTTASVTHTICEDERPERSPIAKRNAPSGGPGELVARRGSRPAGGRCRRRGRRASRSSEAACCPRCRRRPRRCRRGTRRRARSTPCAKPVTRNATSASTITARDAVREHHQAPAVVMVGDRARRAVRTAATAGTASSRRLRRGSATRSSMRCSSGAAASAMPSPRLLVHDEREQPAEVAAEAAGSDPAHRARASPDPRRTRAARRLQAALAAAEGVEREWIR